MQKIFFKKMSGAGNDFILVDKNQNAGLILSSEQIKNLCNRRNGNWADGLITIDDLADHNYKMIYYNADGSTEVYAPTVHAVLFGLRKKPED